MDSPVWAVHELLSNPEEGLSHRSPCPSITTKSRAARAHESMSTGARPTTRFSERSASACSTSARG